MAGRGLGENGSTAPAERNGVVIFMRHAIFWAAGAASAGAFSL
jgi:hypothetical protein